MVAPLLVMLASENILFISGPLQTLQMTEDMFEEGRILSKIFPNEFVNRHGLGTDPKVIWNHQ